MLDMSMPESGRIDRLTPYGGWANVATGAGTGALDWQGGGVPLGTMCARRQGAGVRSEGTGAISAAR